MVGRVTMLVTVCLQVGRAGGSRAAASGAASRRRRWACRVVMMVAALLLTTGDGFAAGGPRPPCGNAPVPAYAGPGSLPTVQVWDRDSGAAAWTPPACTGWAPMASRTLVATAGRLNQGGSVHGLLRRFAAVSALTTIRYWSVTDGRWERLFPSASALNGSDPAAKRQDFRLGELAVGADLYLAQEDNRSSGEVVYRMRVREFGPTRLVVALENVSTMRYLFIPLAGPGALQSLYFFDRQPSGAWGYYSLMRISADASFLLAGRAASYVNRAVALFRFLAGLQTDQRPVPAR